VKMINFFSCWSGQPKQRGSGGLFIAPMHLLPLENSNWLRFGWVRYIRSKVSDTLLEPDEARINLVGRIYPIWGRICPT
jgi:hypothetical protein